MTLEDVDAITGAPMGHPKSASYRTADLVGIDTLVHVADNCVKALEGDEDRQVFEVPASPQEVNARSGKIRRPASP